MSKLKVHYGWTKVFHDDQACMEINGEIKCERYPLWNRETTKNKKKVTCKHCLKRMGVNK